MLRHLTSALLALSLASAARAQSETYTLDQGAADHPRTWEAQPTPEPADPQIVEARAAIAEKDFARAQRVMDEFIDRVKHDGNPYLAEAYLLRADSYLGRGYEYKALFDLEQILREFPESEHFITANEREMDIALAYANGLKKRLLGFRISDGTDYAVEIFIRIQERLPGSALAEKAAITLADFYYQRRDMKLARDAYDLYIMNFPSGPNRVKAERRLIFADVARFKGPRYDTSGLLDARVRIRNFQRHYPAEAERLGVDDGLIARVDESLAAQLLESAKWYLTQSDDPAARVTLTRLIADHPHTFSAVQARTLAEKKGWTIEPAPGSAPAPGPEPVFEGPGSSKVKPVEGDANTPPDDQKKPEEDTKPPEPPPTPNPST